MSTMQEILQRQLNFTNIAKYHKEVYTGKNIVILNAELNGDHMNMTNRVLKEFAPDGIVLNGSFSGKTEGGKLIDYGVLLDGVKYTLEDAITKFKIKLITRSYSGNTPDAILNYLKEIQQKYGVILFNSAGNDGTAGVTGVWSKNDTGISVGAVYIYEDGTVKITHYSSQGNEVDFVAPMGTGSGTSAASPALAGMTACLLDRYGDFNQQECIEILKSISIDLGVQGDDIKYGYGLPILPLTEKLEILEKLRGAEKMQFKDVEYTRWSKAAIDRCVEEGLLVGFEDGTFRPTEHVTREQFAMILTRILDKIEGRQ